jgi:uncharacterized repeat protein (TIGR01451 family)
VNRKMTTLSILLAFLLMVTYSSLPAPDVQAQEDEWFDPRWAYRRPVSVSNPCGQETTGYQVQVLLDSSFDFSHALPDGADLRVTGSDGLTLVPHWIEAWDPAAETASIWVKVPLIPIDGTALYLYYGNPNPPPADTVEVPPIGPWDKHAFNPIDPIGDPGNGDSLLAEDMIYDEETGHYWLVFANYRNGSVGLVWSDDPGDPTAWHWHGDVVSLANAPHLIEHDGTWYLFYADRGHGGPPFPIGVSTAAAVTGPYTYVGSMLEPSQDWEAYRVDEPYVFQRDDGTWIMVYMGDTGSTVEQVGYASADDILGPYTKFDGNPCIPFGPPGSYDAGTVADPWVVEFQGAYYIGYTVSPTSSHPWQTACATTEDWQTFTKLGLILTLGAPGDWDEDNAFRGAVTRIEDTYYFHYTGATASPYVYRMGLATQPAFMPEPLNDPDEVFDFFDPFDGDGLDLTKWTVSAYGGGGTAIVSNGILTITGLAGTNSGYVQLSGTPDIGPGTLLESYGRHLDAGLDAGPEETNTAAEIGYKSSPSSWVDVIRLMDYPDMIVWTLQASSGGQNSGYVDTSIPFDTGWHSFRFYRTLAGAVEFGIDDNSPEFLGPPYVPTIDIRPWLMSYARLPAPQSRFEVDWIRVRQYCGADPDVIIGPEQQLGISIAKTPDAQTVLSGSDVTFTIAITNTSDVALSDIQVVDPLVPGCDRAFDSLEVGSAEIYTCTLANVENDLVNSATVTATALASIFVTDTDTASVDVLPTIQVDKAANPTELVEPGGTVTFTVQVTNNSAEAVTTIFLFDTIHGVLDGQGSCSLPQGLGAHESFTCAFTAVISGSAGYSETDEVIALSIDEDGIYLHASDFATVTITGTDQPEYWFYLPLVHQ